VSVLVRLQRGLETLYRVETGLDVQAFVVDEDGRAEALRGASPESPPGAGTSRRPREQLLVSHEGGDVALGLFLDDAALTNLARNDPAHGLGDHNFWDFCLAVEGVSHFIYVAHRAAGDRQVTALELELQAEVDKFVSCSLLAGARDTAPLRGRLFEQVHYDPTLDDEERSRYQTANDEARRYARSLDRRFLVTGEVERMLIELRRFYRLSLQEKLQHIAHAA
jgi:hypothetical protein